MKKTVTNVILALGLVASIAWAAAAPGMQALIPLLLAVACAIALLSRNTDYITHY